MSLQTKCIFLGTAGALAAVLFYRRTMGRKAFSIASTSSGAAVEALSELSLRRERNFGGNSAKKSVPVALITGALGAGKTSLLKHIMAEASASLTFGVVVNDFAELNIDSMELQRRRLVEDSEVYEMSNGCICCSMKGSFEKMLVQIGARVDYLLVETSGVTNPLEALSLLEKTVQDVKQIKLRLDRLISVVDADVIQHEIQHMLDSTLPVYDRFNHADIVLLNKISLVEKPAQLLASLKQLCPNSTVLRPCDFCRVRLEEIMDVTPIEPAREGGKIQRGEKRRVLVRYKVNRALDYVPRRMAKPGKNVVDHLGEWDSLVFCTEDAPFDFSSFQKVVASPLWRQSVVRLKGTAWFQHDRETRFSIQMSGRERYEVLHEGRWTSPAKIELVAIVKGSFSANLTVKLKRLLTNALSRKDGSPMGGTLKSDVELLKGSLDFASWRQDGFALLRLNGAKRFNKSEATLVQSHNVNLNRANLIFATNINRLPSQYLLALPCMRFDEVGHCAVFDLESLEASLKDHPHMLENAAKLVFNVEFMGKVPNCKCDY